MLLPAVLFAVSLSSPLFAALVGGLVVLLCLSVALGWMLQETRTQLTMEQKKNQRLLTLKTVPTLPDEQDDAASTTAVAELETLQTKHEQLRETYQKLFGRHKKLVTEYKRLHDYLQTLPAGPSTGAQGDGAQGSEAVPQPRPAQQR